MAAARILRDAYSALKAEYSQVWLSENRPYWLNNVTVRYDLADPEVATAPQAFQEASRLLGNGKDLPPAASLGLPAAQVQAGSAH